MDKRKKPTELTIAQSILHFNQNDNMAIQLPITNQSLKKAIPSSYTLNPSKL